MNINFQAGQHPSLVCLLGICEEASSTLVVMEHGEPSMKQWLLGSRALDHQPQYAARHGRVATARSLNFPILWTSADVIPNLFIDFLGRKQAFSSNTFCQFLGRSCCLNLCLVLLLGCTICTKLAFIMVQSVRGMSSWWERLVMMILLSLHNNTNANAQEQSWEDSECQLGVDLESCQIAPDGW